jgi:orotidine-5'-phosphate decarboxylase
MLKPHERIIVALDVDSLEKALPLVEGLAYSSLLVG